MGAPSSLEGEEARHSPTKAMTKLLAELRAPASSSVLERAMELDGSLVANLEAAVRSSQRLRGQRVYPETLQFWSELLAMARRVMGTMIDSETPRIAALGDQLEAEIRERRGG